MKKTIILMTVLLMSGIALAHDPNDMPDNVDVRWSVGEGNIATFDIRLPDKFVKILSKLSTKEITDTVTQMLRSWYKIHKDNWIKSRTDKDMGL